ncbi:MAG: hypothetical protein Q9168_007858 [Polycauliona sp. 1 TL-2023]
MLPRVSAFNRARVMTYGYDSTLVNKKSNDRIKDWADDILRQIGHVRTSESEQQRPFIFICHSLGGIVVKEAMIRLHQHSKQYDNIRLESCGLLFLSTPHSGTTEADWNQFLLDLSEISLGVRSHAIVDELRSFNPSSVDSEESFSAMPKVPPFHCFCEGNKTSVAGKYRQIVTQASAGFYGQKAQKLLNVDHHQICKFDTPFNPAYLNVLARLQDIKMSLLTKNSGAGGIGKTEILLELAFRLRNITNVFSIKPTDAKSLELAFLRIAVSIGHDLLSIRYKNADLASIWRGYSAEERVQAFKTWLGHKDNQPNVFLVDDLDGLCDGNLITAALPSQARVILYSARDPTIMENLERHGEVYHIPDMDTDEMAVLMNATLRRSGSRVSEYAISDVDLESIAGIVSGHALGACRAIAYILNVLSQTSDTPATAFIKSFKGSDWKARRQFLDYKSRLGLSIMETFAISLERMHPAKGPALKLLEAMAFLSNSGKSLHSRDFFGVQRPWLEELRQDLPDYDIFARGLQDQNEYLLDLERVSIGVRPVVPGPLQIHPLWVECIQQRAEHAGRLRWLRQILILCHASFIHDGQQYLRLLDPFTQNLAMIAARFDILPRDLCKDDDMLDWFRNSLPNDIDAHADIGPTTASTSISNNSDDDIDPAEEDTDPRLDATVAAKDAIDQRTKTNLLDVPTTESQMNIVSPSYQTSLLHEHCIAAVSFITSSNPEKLSEEAFAKHVQSYLGLLKRLQEVEKSMKIQATAQGDHVTVLEVYDMLIRMAPAFRSKNPMLGELLRKRKEEFEATLRQGDA